VRVLRKKEDAILHITNGKGFLFDAKIIIASDKKCVAEIIEIQEKPKPWNYYLHIAIAPTKNNDRIEWFLEKATEIGIDEITPIICSNSERRIVKLDRFEKIIQSAMKQSLKFTLPKINEPIKFNDFINQDFEGTFCIAHCEEQDKNLLKSVVNPSEKTTILIGPEGDFSSQEITKALEKNSIPISLGESRLRTETAALVAVQSISFINQ
jgi:16S rRNA (uracil1498-N3)-methyltransferase